MVFVYFISMFIIYFSPIIANMFSFLDCCKDLRDVHEKDMPVVDFSCFKGRSIWVLPVLSRQLLKSTKTMVKYRYLDAVFDFEKSDFYYIFSVHNMCL